MNDKVHELQPRQSNSFSLTPSTLDEAMKFSGMIADSDICPKDFKGKAGNVLVAVQMGAELGIPPLQALQNIAVINGRPSVWGDSLPALARNHPKFEYIDETFDNQTMTATCKIKRRGEPEQIYTFSQSDAQTAGLWGKQGPWQTYPKRMLKMRARAWAIRDVFADALKGLQVAEEVMDYSEPRDMGNAERVENTKPQEPAQLPYYPDDQFSVYLPRWESAILGGTKTPEDVIATVESRYVLSDDQKQQILNIGKQPEQEADDWDKEYDAANQQETEQ